MGARVPRRRSRWGRSGLVLLLLRREESLEHLRHRHRDRVDRRQSRGVVGGEAGQSQAGAGLRRVREGQRGMRHIVGGGGGVGQRRRRGALLSLLLLPPLLRVPLPGLRDLDNEDGRLLACCCYCSPWRRPRGSSGGEGPARSLLRAARPGRGPSGVAAGLQAAEQAVVLSVLGAGLAWELLGWISSHALN